MPPPLVAILAAIAVMGQAGQTAPVPITGNPSSGRVASPPPTIVLDAGGAPKLRPISIATLSTATRFEAVMERGREAVDVAVAVEKPPVPGGSAARSRPMLRLRACRCRGAAILPGRVDLFDAGGRRIAAAPFLVEIRPAPWICWRPRLAGLGGFLIAGVVAGSLLRTRFLPAPSRLARTLLGMHWEGHGTRVEWREVRPQVLRMLECGLRPRARWAAWLKANPLRFAWPGQWYRESLRLDLGTRPGEGSASLTAVPDLPAVLEKSAETHSGRLYVVAGAEGEGVAYYAVPDREGRVGALYLEGAQRGRTARPLVISRPRHLESGGQAGASPRGGGAGWRIVPGSVVDPE